MREKIEIQTTEFLKNKVVETIKKMEESQEKIDSMDIEGAEGFFVSRSKPEGENQIILDVLENEKGEKHFICQKK